MRRAAIKLKNFTTIDSEYGPFIVNRHCAYQAEHLIKTGQPHIQAELEKILAIINTLGDGSIAIDAGANIGLVTIPIAQMLLAKKGQVYAFEAQRMMSYALSGAVALNDLENTFVYHKALGDSLGSLNAETPNYSQPQDFGLFSLTESNPSQAQVIDVITIDSLQLPRCDFIKIDVEGMEISVLKGAQKTIESYQPWLWVEYWKVDIEDIKAQFPSGAYQFYKMDQLNMLCAPVSRLEAAPLAINAPSV